MRRGAGFRWLVHMLLAATALLPVGLRGDTIGAESPAQSAEYNVLLISLDTLRADHLSCCGYVRETSPSLDRLANEGVLFENVTAASSWTIPSHMSMFTSLYPSTHGVESYESRLGDGVPTLAGVLADHGCATAAFVSGPSMSHKLGFDRGFQFYDDFTVTLMHETNLFQDLTEDSLGINQVVTNHVITNLASAWIRKHGKEKKFFLFVHYWDCHSDYVPPAPYDLKFDPYYTGTEKGRDINSRRKDLEKGMPAEDLAHLMALYDGEIAHTDDHVGKLLQLLEEMQLSDRTLVIITSDHGEGFLEHDKILHGNTLYEELVHVPLIMSLPNVLPAGLRVKGNVSHVDVMPTILGLLGIPPPPAVQGADLSPVCLGKEDLPDRMVFSELNLNVTLGAVRWGPYKLIQEKDKPPDRLLLIREGRELGPEESGLPERQSDEIRELMAKALRAGSAVAGGVDYLAQPSELDARTLQLLRSLGYGE